MGGFEPVPQGHLRICPFLEILRASGLSGLGEERNRMQDWRPWQSRVLLTASFFSPGAAIIAIEVVVCSICTEDQLGGRDH